MFDDPIVVNRMQQFHSTMSALQNVFCETCLECFLSGVTNRSRICSHCLTDSEVPKLYSTENNMNPGPVPPELSVSSAIIYFERL